MAYANIIILLIFPNHNNFNALNFCRNKQEFHVKMILVQVSWRDELINAVAVMILEMEVKLKSPPFKIVSFYKVVNDDNLFGQLVITLKIVVLSKKYLYW